jgi:lysozyme
MPFCNPATVALIKEFEGCVLHTYLDAVGVPTIGYGQTGDEASPGRVITQAQADTMLANSLHVYEKGVQDLAYVQLTPNQFGALVSFAYNLGLGSLKASTLLKLVNDKLFRQAAEAFGNWVYADGQRLGGLVRRRAAEAALFLK